MYIKAAMRGEAHFIRANTLPIMFVIGWITLATTVVRSVGWRLITRAFFIGMFAHMAMAYPMNRLMKIPFGENMWTIAMWVPLMEETTRFALLGLLGWLLNRAFTRRTGMADMVTLGASMGLGFSFHEDMLYPRAMAAFHEPGIFAGFFEPWGLIFPSAVNSSGPTGIGHLAGGIAIGAAVALIFAFRGPQRVFGLIGGILLVSMAVFYHGIWNAFELPDSIRGFFVSTEPWVHLLIIAGAIGVDLFRRTLRPPETVAPSLVLYKIAHRNAESPIRWAERMMAVSRFRREYNAGAYARAHDDAVPDLRTDLRLRHWLAVATRLPRVTTPGGPAHVQHTSGTPVQHKPGSPVQYPPQNQPVSGQGYGVDPNYGDAGEYGAGEYGAGGYGSGTPVPGGYGATPDSGGYGTTSYGSGGYGAPETSPQYAQPDDPSTGYGPSGGPTGG